MRSHAERLLPHRRFSDTLGILCNIIRWCASSDTLRVNSAARFLRVGGTGERVPRDKVGRPLGVRLRLQLGSGQATGGASNAIDIAIAITGFITEQCRRRAVREAAFWP